MRPASREQVHNPFRLLGGPVRELSFDCSLGCFDVVRVLRSKYIDRLEHASQSWPHVATADDDARCLELVQELLGVGFVALARRTLTSYNKLRPTGFDHHDMAGGAKLFLILASDRRTIPAHQFELPHVATGVGHRCIRACEW